MNRLEAHELLAHHYRDDRADLWSWLPEGVQPRVLHGIDTSVATLTAAASLSGQLEDAHDLLDLKAACEHFASLWSADVFSVDQWNAEAVEVIGELLAWGERATAHERN